ncbi:MAG TPA: Uma2 family endonuclease [Thermoanaerobaculia bacterium]|nr:Uma2 family endonuclease [Thermoanaerobaculia bacterium]
MSQSAAAAFAHLPFELVLDDGEPLETDWHTRELPLLRHLLLQAMAEQGRTDFFAGANIFVYYSVEQAREVAEEMAKGLPWRAFRGPDVFWVGGVEPRPEREAWIAWEEGGRLPDVVFEMLSPSTAKKDRTEKRDLYARVFGTAEYFLYEPETGKLEGLRLAGRFYQPIQPDEHGRLWSEQLGASVGLWRGIVEKKQGVWVRLFRPDGSLIPTQAEAEHQRAEAEHQRAEAERQRADAAEAELARLRALLAERGRG